MNLKISKPLVGEVVEELTNFSRSSATLQGAGLWQHSLSLGSCAVDCCTRQDANQLPVSALEPGAHLRLSQTHSVLLVLL